MKFQHSQLFALSLLASAVQTTQAQQSANRNEEIYELVTTAIHQRSAQTALPVTLLTGDKLHRLARSTIGDTLANQPGINNSSFGPAVGQAVIRGQQGRRVMNLTNSIANADASGNSPDHAQSVEPILATSIEVLRGPATLLYGGGAIGGVVNVIDQRIATALLEKPEFAAETRYDSGSNQHSNVVALNFATGPIVWHLDGVKRGWENLEIPDLAIDPDYLAAEEAKHQQESAEEHAAHEEEQTTNSNGFVSNTGGDTTNVTGGMSWLFDSGHLGFAYSTLNNDYGLPPGAHAEHDEEGEESKLGTEADSGAEQVSIRMQRKRYDIDGEWQALHPWVEKLSYKLSKIDYKHAEIENQNVVGTQFDNASWQQRLQLTHPEFNGWHGALGAQYSFEDFGAVGAESFIPQTEAKSQGIFVIEDFHTEGVTFEFGARLNHDEYQPQQSAAPSASFNTQSFSGSALWQAQDNFTVGLLIAHSERAPSIEELYSNYGVDDLADCVIHFATGACELGNTSFKAESSLNTDLNLNWDYDTLNATVTFFNNDFADYIGQITSGEEVDGFPIRLYQQLDATFHGIEVDMSWQFSDLFSVRLFGDSTRGRFNNQGDVPRMPPTRVGAELNYAQGAWSAYATVVHARQQNKPGFFELNSDSWTKVELGVDYATNLGKNDTAELLLFAHVRNLNDETIRLATSYLRSFAPEVGRSIETGIRLRF